MSEAEIKPIAKIVYDNEYERLFIDGKLIAKRHSLRAAQVLAALGYNVKYEKEGDWDDDE